MDCRTARLLLDFSRPRCSELRPSEALDLENHLHGCPECDALARTDRRADEHLGRSMREVPLPVGLRQRVMDRLAKDRAARRQRWLVRAAGVAAAFLLVAVSWWLWAAATVPALDVDRIHEQAFREQVESPDSGKVTAWFREKYHVTTVAPSQIGEAALNYNLLVSYGMEDLLGQQVPMLRFRQGANTARVYIVTDWQFRIKDVTDGAVFPGSGQNISVWKHPSNPHLAYVIVYTGESLRPFLLDFPSGA
jgi:anti-sigma factor RsiW